MQYVRKLMEKDLQVNPSNLRNRAQVAAIFSVENPARALQLAKETLEICKDKKESNAYQWQIAMVFGLMESLQKDCREAEEEYERLRSETCMQPLAEYVACYRLARMCVMKTAFAKAVV